MKNKKTDRMIHPGTATILIVDDIKINVDVLVQHLKDHYTLAVALNGKDALRFARAHQPDLILLDIVMPEMDGFEVCTKLKSDPKTRDIPVIFFTARDNPQHQRQCLECGGADYIAKPFSPEAIIKKVKKHLGRG